MWSTEAERSACVPKPLVPGGFNPGAAIPHGCSLGHIKSAMEDFLGFLQFVNEQLNTKQLTRLEMLLMPANFSSIVGEFIARAIPRYCAGLVRNRHHNGHPDLLPAGRFAGDATLHGDQGIEIKASRYTRGWQGHNAENVWLMVFVFEANRSDDESRGLSAKAFRFIKVVGAELAKSDWKFSGRAGESRRTITASVTPSGFDRMERNWIYRSGVE